MLILEEALEESEALDKSEGQTVMDQSRNGRIL